MRRWLVLVFLASTCLIAPALVTAQTHPEATVAALETQVAALQATVAAQATALAADGRASPVTEPAPLTTSLFGQIPDGLQPADPGTVAVIAMGEPNDAVIPIVVQNITGSDVVITNV